MVDSKLERVCKVAMDVTSVHYKGISLVSLTISLNHSVIDGVNLTTVLPFEHDYSRVLLPVEAKGVAVAGLSDVPTRVSTFDEVISVSDIIASIDHLRVITRLDSA